MNLKSFIWKNYARDDIDYYFKFNDDFLERNNISLDKIKHIDSGGSGDVFSISRDKVIKFTSNEREIKITKKIIEIQKTNKLLHYVEYFDDQESEGTAKDHCFIMEKLKTFNSMESFCHDFAYYNGDVIPSKGDNDYLWFSLEARRASSELLCALGNDFSDCRCRSALYSSFDMFYRNCGYDKNGNLKAFDFYVKEIKNEAKVG